MTAIRLTKIFDFEAAHALADYDGACRQIHGHSYKLHVTVRGPVINAEHHPKNGMVMDFKDLKVIVKKYIIEKYDHALILEEGRSLPMITALTEAGHKVVLTPFPPTCEKMLHSFAQVIASKLPEQVKLHSLRLFETATSYADWYAEDQE